MEGPLSKTTAFQMILPIHFSFYLFIFCVKVPALRNVFLFHLDCFDARQARICRFQLFFQTFNVARHFVQQGGFLYSHNSDIPTEHVCFGVDEYLWVLNCFLC